MRKLRQVIIGGLVAAATPVALGGCYLYAGETFADWPEVRMPRDGGGEMVGLVKPRGEKDWPGESYEVLIRWPTALPLMPRDLAPAQREKEGRAFIEKLCGEGRDIYIVLKSFNDRNGEVYYNLWCKPPKKTA